MNKVVRSCFSIKYRQEVKMFNSVFSLENSSPRKEFFIRVYTAYKDFLKYKVDEAKYGSTKKLVYGLVLIELAFYLNEKRKSYYNYLDYDDDRLNLKSSLLNCAAITTIGRYYAIRRPVLLFRCLISGFSLSFVFVYYEEQLKSKLSQIVPLKEMYLGSINLFVGQTILASFFVLAANEMFRSVHWKIFGYKQITFDRKNIVIFLALFIFYKLSKFLSITNVGSLEYIFNKFR